MVPRRAVHLTFFPLPFLASQVSGMSFATVLARLRELVPPHMGQSRSPTFAGASSALVAARPNNSAASRNSRNLIQGLLSLWVRFPTGPMGPVGNRTHESLRRNGPQPAGVLGNDVEHA